MKRWSKRLMVILVFTFFLLSISVALAADGCKAVYGNGSHRFTLATGSPGELGLLEVLAEAFNKNHDTSMVWRKAGSGASLKLLKEKKVDVVMVHAPAAEKKALQEGWAIKRMLIGSNEFCIVGPKAPHRSKVSRPFSSTSWVQKKARTLSAAMARTSMARACTMMRPTLKSMTIENPNKKPFPVASRRITYCLECHKNIWNV